MVQGWLSNHFRRDLVVWVSVVLPPVQSGNNPDTHNNSIRNFRPVRSSCHSIDDGTLQPNCDIEDTDSAWETERSRLTVPAWDQVVEEEVPTKLEGFRGLQVLGGLAH